MFSYTKPVWDEPHVISRAEHSLKASGQFTALLGPLTANGTTLSPAQYSRLHALLGDPTTLPPTPPADAGRFVAANTTPTAPVPASSDPKGA